MRVSEIHRKTRETDISLRLDLDGTGKCNINTDCGFLNHMLELFQSIQELTLTYPVRVTQRLTFTTRLRMWALSWVRQSARLSVTKGELPVTAV